MYFDLGTKKINVLQRSKHWGESRVKTFTLKFWLTPINHQVCNFMFGTTLRNILQFLTYVNTLSLMTGTVKNGTFYTEVQEILFVILTVHERFFCTHFSSKCHVVVWLFWNSIFFWILKMVVHLQTCHKIRLYPYRMLCVTWLISPVDICHFLSMIRI